MKPLRVIHYKRIEDKNKIEAELSQPALSPEQALIKTLDWMDFMAALRGPKPVETDDGIDWIVLHIRKDHDKQRDTGAAE